MDRPVVLAMAVMLSWRFAHGQPGHEQTRAMIHPAQAPHPRRQGMKILEHPVLHAMPLPPQGDHLALPAQWQHMSANTLGRVLLEALPRGTSGDLSAFLRQAQLKYGPLADSPLACPAWAPLSRALVTGRWYADVTPRFRRCDTGECWAALLILRHACLSTL